MNDLATTLMFLFALMGGMLLFVSVIGFIADYIIDDKTGRVRKMRYAILNVSALGLCFLLDLVRGRVAAMEEEEHTGDDPRPATLRNKVEL